MAAEVVPSVREEKRKQGAMATVARAAARAAVAMEAAMAAMAKEVVCMGLGST